MSGGLFLGVDGGGSKTELVLVDGDLAVLGQARVGPTYHPSIGVAGVAARLADGVAAVLAPLGLRPAAITHAFFGLPAHGEDAVADPQLAAACGALLGHDRYLCGNDMMCGWAGSLGLRDGINLVAGTGSIAYGECEGRAGRAGGWGELLGDEGSGYWIALRALQAFTRMSDGRDERGPLHALLTARLALEHDLQLCERVTGPAALARDSIAALAPVVVEAAQAGDPAAVHILAEAGRELATIVLALSRTLRFGVDRPVALAWSGSILTEVPVVRAAMLADLGNDRFEIVAGGHPPAIGAALLARRAASQARDGSRRAAGASAGGVAI